MDLPLRDPAPEGFGQKEGSGNPGENQVFIGRKPEAFIESRLAQHHAARRIPVVYLIQSRLNELPADSHPLQPGIHSHRAESDPVVDSPGGAVINLHGRKSNLPHHFAVRNHRHQGKQQGLTFPQPLQNLVFILLTMGIEGKRLKQQICDLTDVLRLFFTDFKFHSCCLSHLLEGSQYKVPDNCHSLFSRLYSWFMTGRRKANVFLIRLLMKPTSLTLLLPLVALFSASCRKPNEFQPPPPPEVTAENPEVRDVVLYESFPGRVEARDSVVLVARVSGFLDKIHFEDGAWVKKGDLLFTIEQDNYQAALNAAKASLAQTKAGLSLAEASLSRKKKAFESQAVSELDVLTAEADVEAAEAAVQVAASSVERAELDLSYTEITAPMDGVMSASSVSEGNLVGPGAVSDLALLLSVQQANVFFSMDERRLLPKLRLLADNSATMKKNIPPVKLAMADGEDYPLEGTLDYIDNALDPNTGTLQVRALFENPDQLLIQGMFARVKIPVNLKDAMLVPEVAVQRDLVGSYVYTLTAEDSVESTYIQLGALMGEERIVRSGLEKSARVVTRGIQRVRPGVKVTTGSPSVEE